MSDPNHLRTVILRPYRRGYGPTFRLETWDTGRMEGSHTMLRYRLTMHNAGKRSVIFEGADFGTSPCHAIDSDATLASLMGFLTLRPGDTDSEYFEAYTPDQLAYASAHAEALSCECLSRFGE